MTETISQNVAGEFLQRLNALELSAVKKIAGDAGICFGFGRTFSVDDAVLQNGEISIKKRSVSQYALCVCGEVELCGVNHGSVLLNRSTPLSQIRQLRPAVLNQRVRSVEISQCNQICIVLDDCIIRNEVDAYWFLHQPGTQEEALRADSKTIELWTTIPRRWSPDQADNRDRWHSMREFDKFFEEDGPEEQIASADARSVISQILGTKLQYAVKSKDINLFDCGFAGSPDFAFSLHISCAVTCKNNEGTSAILYGDTPVEEYRLAFEGLIGSRVLEVDLHSGNVLAIRLENGNIEVIAAGDGEESWRFLTPERHIVASDLAIWQE